MVAELSAAVTAVATALAALRANPRATAVQGAIARAGAELASLEPGLTTIVLGRLLASIEDCHRDGVSGSPRLSVCARTVSRALRLDPRWVPSAAGARSPRSA